MQATRSTGQDQAETGLEFRLSAGPAIPLAIFACLVAVGIVLLVGSFAS